MLSTATSLQCTAAVCATHLSRTFVGISMMSPAPWVAKPSRNRNRSSPTRRANCILSPAAAAEHVQTVQSLPQIHQPAAHMCTHRQQGKPTIKPHTAHAQCSTAHSLRPAQHCCWLSPARPLTKSAALLCRQFCEWLHTHAYLDVARRRRHHKPTLLGWPLRPPHGSKCVHIRQHTSISHTAAGACTSDNTQASADPDLRGTLLSSRTPRPPASAPQHSRKQRTQPASCYCCCGKG